MRHIADDERRARLAVRHRLAPSTRTDDVLKLVRDLVVLHATDASTVYLSAALRMVTPAIAPLERALYDDRSVLRMLGMRRTMFVVVDELAPIVQSSTTDAVAAVERRRLVKDIEVGGIAKDGERWVRDVSKATLAFVEQRGEALASEVTAAVPALAAKLSFGEGKKWAGTQGVSTRVLSLLAAEGSLVRGRPRGTWTSSQYRWSPMSAWIGDRAHAVSTEDAQAELARRYLRTYGPATIGDLKWWTGWTLGAARRAVAAIDTVEVETQAGRAFVLADDDDEPAAVEPWAALLPSLDPTAMGWTARDWYLGPHREALFDYAGNVGPTVWVDGRIVGGWAQRPDGTVVHRVLERVAKAATARIEAEVERVTTLLGTTRVTPRMRTPLERELAAS